MPLPDFATLQQLFDKITAVVVLAWAVVAFLQGWIVPSSVHKAAIVDRDDWKARHDRIAQIAEMTLRAKVGGGL